MRAALKSSGRETRRTTSTNDPDDLMSSPVNSPAGETRITPDNGIDNTFAMNNAQYDDAYYTNMANQFYREVRDHEFVVISQGKTVITVLPEALCLKVTM
jgi:hypothetical protein